MNIDRATLTEVVRAAVTEAVAAVPRPVFRPGTVTAVTSMGLSVRVDGDTSPVDAQVVGEVPGVGGRVMVMFSPPSAVIIVGIIGAGGPPPGTVAWYAGPITADTGDTGTPPPPGWLWCHGQAYSVSQYIRLFGAIGYTYGGSAQTFNVPNEASMTLPTSHHAIIKF